MQRYLNRTIDLFSDKAPGKMLAPGHVESFLAHQVAVLVGKIHSVRAILSPYRHNGENMNNGENRHNGENRQR